MRLLRYNGAYSKERMMESLMKDEQEAHQMMKAIFISYHPLFLLRI